MSITAEFERLIADNDLKEKLAVVQDLQGFQQFYNKMREDGLVQKRQYSLAPVNVLGTNIPGQTTYRFTFGDQV